MSRSTTKVEYRSLALATAEIIWLESLLVELHVQAVSKATIWCDNLDVVAVLANLILHYKFKHVKLDLFFVRENVPAGKLVIRGCTSW